MNIDKQSMELAWNNRDNPKSMNELIGYFDEMAHYFANHFKIRSWLREDFMQEATIYAFKAIEKYNPKVKSTPFSYFYKVFYTGFLYLMRREKMKADKRPKLCSFEAFSNSLSRDNLEYEETHYVNPYEKEESFIYIDGKCFEKEALKQAVKEAKKLKKAGIFESDNQLTSFILDKMKELHSKNNA